jgi:16S rRNA processing protein RimM
MLVSFDGTNDRDGAEALRGLTLTILASERRRLDPDEFWPEDLVGLEVRNPGGGRIGRVVGIDAEAPQPHLDVETEEGVFVVPLVTALVPEVNVAAGYLVIEPVDGLLGEPEA